MYELITEKTMPEYEAFILSHPKGHFTQSSMWGKQKTAWTFRAVVVRGDDGKIKGSMGILIRKAPIFPASMLYCCRGPVCDLDDRETFAQLLEGAKDLAKQYHGYVIKIDPDVPKENTEFRAMLESFGFECMVKGKNFEGINPRFVFRLNVEGKTEEELLASFTQKHRYNIRLATRKGVEVKICGKEMVPAFTKIMVETGMRDNFVTRDETYFANMLDNLGEHARLYMAFHEGQPIAGTLAIWFGDKVWYLYGASSNTHRNLMPNYLLQWEMIRWAVEKKCRIYDFRGVSGDLTEDNPLYGLYKFKKGFNGDFTEFVGEFDLVLSKFWYDFLKVATKGYRSLATFRYMLKNRDSSPEAEKKAAEKKEAARAEQKPAEHKDAPRAEEKKEN